MAHRLERLPEQAGNAGLNMAPSGGVAVSVAQEHDPPATVAVTRTKKSIHALLVSANGTEPGMYRGEINCEVTLDALFA